MQRWIVGGLLVAMLAMVGGVFGYWQLRQNRPDRMWMPLPFVADTPLETQKEEAAKLYRKLSEPERMTTISREFKLADRWSLSETEAAAELGRRLFVEAGQMEGPAGPVPTLNIGFRGKVKEKELLGGLAQRTLKDVWAILGLQPPSSSSY